MSPSLMDKLRMIDAPSRAVAADVSAEDESASDCYFTEQSFSLDVFSPLRHMTKQNLEDIFSFSLPRPLAPEQLVFLDTETTGLSGGVGTLAFLVGLGHIENGRFMVRQYLMRDYQEEPYMLSAVADELSRFRMLVTFNGKSFDAPLLRSRLLMNRISTDSMPTLHADMLYPSRRVWKLRLGSCTLGRLEEAVLGVHREDDLPGSQVPRTYFAYLKNRDFGPIERILGHNRQDIVSLGQLFFYLCMRYDRPEEAVSQLDLYSMANALQKNGAQARAMKCYRLCAGGSLRREAFGALAAQEKRMGRTQAAVMLYRAMLARGENQVESCVALAKLCEHQLGDPLQALDYTRQALLLLSEPRLYDEEAVQQRRNELQYRYARLQGKTRKW